MNRHPDNPIVMTIHGDRIDLRAFKPLGHVYSSLGFAVEIVGPGPFELYLTDETARELVSHIQRWLGDE